MLIFKDKEEIKNDLNEILENIKHRDSRIKYLENELKRLKSDAYKDEELAKMQAKVTIAYEDLYRGFPISIEAADKIKAFKKEHIGLFKYEFTPTPLGIVGIITASNGDQLTFQDIE